MIIHLGTLYVFIYCVRIYYCGQFWDYFPSLHSSFNFNIIPLLHNVLVSAVHYVSIYMGDAHNCSPKERYLAAIEADQKVNPETIDDLFKLLPPVKPDQLLGDWNGGFFDTGHPVATQLDEIQWIGKSFKSVEDVDPVIVVQGGKRVSWGKWGFASVSLFCFLFESPS